MELTENQKAWIAALRSGKFKQTKHILCRDNSYCCLGVLCEVASENGVSLIREMQDRGKFGVEVLYSDDGEKFSATSPTDGVLEWLGLTYDGQLLSMEMNDDLNFSFERIADAIEANPEKYFRG